MTKLSTQSVRLQAASSSDWALLRNSAAGREYVFTAVSRLVSRLAGCAVAKALLSKAAWLLTHITEGERPALPWHEPST